MRSSDWFLRAKNKLINPCGTFVFDRFLCSVSLFVLIRYDVPVSSDAFIRKEIFWYFSSWKGKSLCIFLTHSFYLKVACAKAAQFNSD